jgi:hypothetical protein
MTRQMLLPDSIIEALAFLHPASTQGEISTAAGGGTRKRRHNKWGNPARYAYAVLPLLMM